MFIQKWINNTKSPSLLPLPLLLNKRDTDGKCRRVIGREGHKTDHILFSVSHDDILLSRGEKQASAPNVSYGYPEDNVQTARQLQLDSMKLCNKQSGLAWE